MGWCIERENPILPKSENDKPVQFWQLRKTGTKVCAKNMTSILVALTSPIRLIIIIASSVFFPRLQNGDIFLVATGTPQEAAPVLGRGALCADSMGLWVSVSILKSKVSQVLPFFRGKTLTMIALVLATKADVPRDFSNSTLIGWFNCFSPASFCCQCLFPSCAAICSLELGKTNQGSLQ